MINDYDCSYFLNMKTVRRSRPSAGQKILKQQASKIKDKLQLLKKQIEVKKQNKQTQNFQTAVNNFLKTQSRNQAASKHSHNLRSSTTGSNQKNEQVSKTQRKNQLSCTLGQQNHNSKQKQTQTDLWTLLEANDLGYIFDRLHRAGIYTLRHCSALEANSFDSQKQIPIGHRIKLRKIILKLKELIEKQQVSNQKQIQGIVKERKEENVFIAISRQSEEPQLDKQAQLEEVQQQAMIQSLMSVFRPRRSIMLKNKSLKTKKVSWHPNIDQVQTHSQHKTYPKELSHRLLKPNQPYDALGSSVQKHPTYCWKCFKQTKDNSYIYQGDNGNKTMCSEQCLQAYKCEIGFFNGKKEQQGNKEQSIDLCIL